MKRSLGLQRSVKRVTTAYVMQIAAEIAAEMGLKEYKVRSCQVAPYKAWGICTDIVRNPRNEVFVII